MNPFLQWQPIAASLAIGAGGFFIAIFARMAKDFSGSVALMRGIETFLTGSIAAYGAYAFMAFLLSLGDRSHGAVEMLAVLFLPLAALVNLGFLAGGHGMSGDTLLWIALAFGGLTGMFDGIWAAQDWEGLGWIAFPLDVTWGLSGSSNGVFMHLFNAVFGEHADDAPNAVGSEVRRCEHRYISGFRMQGKGSTFTQGSVMSNTGDEEYGRPGGERFRHETIHSWQNRGFGPFLWTTYVGWMAVLLIPSLLAAIALGGGVIKWWTYFNNPWEVMAFAIANPEKREAWAPPAQVGPDAVGPPKRDKRFMWPGALVIGLAIPALPGLAALLVWLSYHFGVFG